MAPVKLIFFFIAFLLTGCSAEKTIWFTGKSKLRLFGIYEIPHNTTFHRTVVGGLSGIDYNPVEDVFYMISDDPSKFQPARFYTARLFFNGSGIEDLRLLDVDTLQQENGKMYPSALEDRRLASDPEAIRFDPTRGQLAWVSEGEKFVSNDSVILQDPQVNIMDMQGRTRRSFLLPANVKMKKEDLGPRPNSSFEGFTYAANSLYAYVSMESPLFEDGHPAGTGDSSALVRIIKYEVASGRPLAQYAYEIDPVAYAPATPGGFKINGVTEILWLENENFLVVERSFSTGRQANVIKIYLADLSSAKDVRSVASLRKGRDIPVSKELILNLESLGIFIDNVEGICRGPKLPNGKQSLVLITDNNFSPIQKTQLMVLQVE